MTTKLVGANTLKVGGFIVFDGKACKVASIDISKTGKHGHAKARIVAVGLIDGIKIIKVFPGHNNVEVPIIEKKSAQVLSVHGDTANVMDMDNYETFDIKIPEDLQGQVTEGVQVLYWIIMNEKIIKQVK